MSNNRTLSPSAFKRHRYLKHPHLQTVVATMLPQGDTLTGGREHLIELNDGDRLSAWVHEGERAIVHLWHGLGGHADSGYVVRAGYHLNRLGYGVVRWNHRGCGSGQGKARGIYHSGRSDDLAAGLRWARTCWPNALHLIVGFSLSGNALLYLLGHDKTELPDAAISVNAPIDLGLCAEKLGEGINRIYDVRFALLCCQSIRRRVARGLAKRKPPLSSHLSLTDFDDHVTAPLGGFKDRFDYYATCSAGPWLGAIETPTLILAADDDPMVPITSYRAVADRLSDQVQLVITHGGGHMGYLSDAPGEFGTRRWLDHRICHGVTEFESRLRGTEGLAGRAS